jgi:hypothetical protein
MAAKKRRAQEEIVESFAEDEQLLVEYGRTFKALGSAASVLVIELEEFYDELRQPRRERVQSALPPATSAVRVRGRRVEEDESLEEERTA